MIVGNSKNAAALIALLCPFRHDQRTAEGQPIRSRPPEPLVASQPYKPGSFPRATPSNPHPELPRTSEPAFSHRTWNRPAESTRAISEPAATMATGPDSCPAILPKLVTIWVRPLATTPDNLRVHAPEA